MIKTGNREIDAAFAELHRQLEHLSGECAALAGRVAVLQDQLVHRELERLRVHAPADKASNE